MLAAGSYPVADGSKRRLLGMCPFSKPCGTPCWTSSATGRAGGRDGQWLMEDGKPETDMALVFNLKTKDQIPAELVSL